jgi:hypothetical protein
VSGLAISLLTSTSTGIQSGNKEVILPEKKLYTNIINMGHYKSRGLRLIDYEDTDIVVDQQFDKFAEIYRPIINEIEPFKHNVQLL